MTASARADLPVGVVTMLFSDIEGSTRLLHSIGDEYGIVLAEHHRLLREVWLAHDGVEVSTEGDAFFVAFADASQAVRSALAAQRVLSAHDWAAAAEVRVRMGVHTGSPRVRDGNYWGLDVHYAARLCAAAHGGQVLISESTAGLADVVVQDLGEHALKDFPAARRIFHLPVEGRGKDQFPAPRTVRTGRTNLPDQPSSFVGREAELERLRALAANARLVTLTGTGGVGKTRLAVRLGSELLDGSGDGVWFVDLASLTDGMLVALRTAEVLEVTVAPGRDPLDAIHERLSDRRLVVILDNCEHVVEAAASFVAGVLARCPGILVLATSREPLGIPGEHVHRVPSLSIPSEEIDDLSVLADSEAVQLFVQRAAAQRPGFALDGENAAAVAHACRRLDGIPLAIELAAVRLRSMSIGDLNARLDRRMALLKGGSRTALPRQQTLQALIDWSYELLSEPERIVLARLSVFASGGFDLAAAEAVCSGRDISEFEVLDHVDALVDKSLVQAEDSADGSRYRLLETVREYASAKLGERGEEEVAAARRSHRDHYLSLVQTAAPNLPGPDRLAWLDRLSLEQDNLRLALTECQRDSDPGPGLRFAAALMQFWGVRGHASEAADSLARQLGRPEAAEPTLDRGYALAAASHLHAAWLADYATAQEHAQESLAIGRRHQDHQLTAEALRSLAWAHAVQGDLTRALELADQGLAIAREREDAWLLASLLSVRGAALAQLDRDARPDFEESLDLGRRHGSPYHVAVALHNLAQLDFIAGDVAAASVRLQEALTIHRDLGESAEVAIVSCSLGWARYACGEGTAAAVLFREAVTAAHRDGDPSLLGRALVGAALTRPDPAAAARLHGAGDTLLERVGYMFDATELQLRIDHWERCKAQLGEAAFLAAYAAGREQPRGETISLALSDPPAAD